VRSDAGGDVGPAEHSSLGQRSKQIAQGALVLGGKHLGRRQKCGLSTRVDDPEHRPQGDDRLACAHVALEQAQHRRLVRDVREDLVSHANLAARERKRQPGVEGVQEPSDNGRARCGGVRHPVGPPACEGGLKHQSLLVAKPTLARVDRGLIGRNVHSAERLKQRGQPVRLA